MLRLEPDDRFIELRKTYDLQIAHNMLSFQALELRFITVNAVVGLKKKHQT